MRAASWKRSRWAAVGFGVLVLALGYATATALASLSGHSNPRTSTYECVGSPVTLFDNWNGDEVSNDGAMPSFTTDGAYCLTSINDYHWNDGQGATPGTIGLVSEESPDVGPYDAVGSPGSATEEYPDGVPNADWTVTVGTSNPVVIDGTYSCDDSDPSTWSQDTASEGDGFCEVMGEEAEETTTTSTTETTPVPTSLLSDAKFLHLYLGLIAELYSGNFYTDGLKRVADSVSDLKTEIVRDYLVADPIEDQTEGTDSSPEVIVFTALSCADAELEALDAELDSGYPMDVWADLVRKSAAGAGECLKGLNGLPADPDRDQAVMDLQDSLAAMFKTLPPDDADLPAFAKDQTDRFYAAKLEFLTDFFDETIDGVSFVSAFEDLDQIDSELARARAFKPDDEDRIKGALAAADDAAGDLVDLINNAIAMNGMAPNGPGALGPCGCARVKVSLSHFTVHMVAPVPPRAGGPQLPRVGSTYVGFDLDWTMTCTASLSPLGCAAQIVAEAPALAGAAGPSPARWRSPTGPQPDVTIVCAGDCGEITKGSQALSYTAFIRSKPAPAFTPAGRANNSFDLDIKITCTPPGKPPVVKTVKLTIVFDDIGQVNAGASTLTGST